MWYFYLQQLYHDDFIKWKHLPRNWSFVRGIYQSSVDSPHKGQWPVTLMFSKPYAPEKNRLEQTIKMPVIWDAIALIMTSL